MDQVIQFCIEGKMDQKIRFCIEGEMNQDIRFCIEGKMDQVIRSSLLTFLMTTVDSCIRINIETVVVYYISSPGI